MALVIADRVKETTASTGTGSVTLAGAFAGFQTFGTAIGDTNTTYYAIVLVGGSEWEVGTGTYSSTGDSLSRDSVFASSNSGALVDFSAGNKDVFCVAPAERAVVVNGSTVQIPNSATVPIASGGTGASTASGALSNLGLTATAAELNYVDGVTSNVQTQLDAMVEKSGDSMTGDLSFGDNDKAIFGAGSDLQIYHDSASGNSFIDESGTGNLVVRGVNIEFKKFDGEKYLSCAANGATNLFYDGSSKLATTSTGVTVTGALNATTLQIGGTSITSTAAELNILDGVTATATEINLLDGVTATTAELNILDGVTATASELNILDGVTATATEINYVDGVTSSVQTQIDNANSNALALSIALG